MLRVLLEGVYDIPSLHVHTIVDLSKLGARCLCVREVRVGDGCDARGAQASTLDARPKGSRSRVLPSWHQRVARRTP